MSHEPERVCTNHCLHSLSYVKDGECRARVTIRSADEDPYCGHVCTFSEPAKRPCRKCGELIYHKNDCSLSTTEPTGPNTVLDSERVPEPVPAVLHCGCGAAVTPEEYEEHRKRGHDADWIQPKDAAVHVQKDEAIAEAVLKCGDCGERDLHDPSCHYKGIVIREQCVIDDDESAATAESCEHSISLTKDYVGPKSGCPIHGKSLGVEAQKDEIVSICVRCRGEFTAEQTKGCYACPGCGSQGVPMSPKENVTVAINWHELRILTIWAEHYASSIKDNADVKDNPVQVVFSIAKALQDQHPLLSPLTLSGEIESLKQDPRYKNITTHGIESGGPVSGGDNEIG